MKSLPGVERWESFAFKNKKWIALDRAGAWNIWDYGLNYYGAWETIENFKLYYSEDGEKLAL